MLEFIRRQSHCQRGSADEKTYPPLSGAGSEECTLRSVEWESQCIVQSDEKLLLNEAGHSYLAHSMDTVVQKELSKYPDSAEEFAEAIYEPLKSERRIASAEVV